MQPSSLGQGVMKGRGIVSNIPVLDGAALVACAIAAEPAVQYS